MLCTVWHPDLLSHPGSQDRFGRHVVTPDVVKCRSPVLPPILVWESHLIVPWVFEAGATLRATAVPPSLPCALPASPSFEVVRTPTRVRSGACARMSVGPLSPSSPGPLPPPFSLCTCTAEFVPRPEPPSRRPPCRPFRGMLSPPCRRMVAGNPACAGTHTKTTASRNKTTPASTVFGFVAKSVLLGPEPGCLPPRSVT